MKNVTKNGFENYGNDSNIILEVKYYKNIAIGERL